MTQYRANWNAIPNHFNNGRSSFRFQAADDATAQAIVDVITAALSAQLTSLNKYVGHPFVYTAGGRPVGTNRHVRIEAETDAGAFKRFYLRNITHSAVEADLTAPFLAGNAVHQNGDPFTIVSAPLRYLRRTEAEQAQRA